MTHFEKLAATALIAFVLGSIGGYVASQQRTAIDVQRGQARYNRLREHMQGVRFMLTAVTPDENGAALARKAAFRLGLDPDELPPPE